ncbi:MAG: YccF domain-containing protein [Bacillota bacterium]|nr:YccF domain-containing protein [Bacillota bacterium]
MERFTPILPILFTRSKIRKWWCNSRPWILLIGWELCITHLVVGASICLTIIGIPFGLQHLKLAKLAILPFGARISRSDWH